MTDGRVGGKIRQLREQQQLSQEQLAERADCDVALIVQLEEGEVAAGLAPLIKITRALGCRLGTLLDDDEQSGPVVNRSDDAKSVTRFGSAGAGGLDFFSLAADKSARHMEPFLITAEPLEGTDYTLSTHEGEEFIYVLDGELEIVYGKDTVKLQAGDSVYYDSIVPHHVHAAGSAAAQFLAVVYAPL